MRILIFLLCVALPVVAAERATLRGKVLDATGAPVENATVLIYKAGVKTGYSTYCPTCYVDCGKRVSSGVDGEFVLSGLSPDLLFTLLVLHDGNKTATVDKADPAKGALAAVALKPSAPVDDVSRVLRGRVTDLQGKPLANAVVEQLGVFLPSGGQQYGSPAYADSIAVSNDKGEFEVANDKPATKMIISIAARGMAPKIFTDGTGADRKTMSVAEGATVRGRLLTDGKPVANAEVGLMSYSRRSGTTYPEVRIGTQEDGTFAITNVPAGRIWVAYPKMESLATSGVAGRAVTLETKDNGEDVNLGDIALAPAYRLSGKVLLSDGKPIPEGMRLSLSSALAWDSQTVMPGPDGWFEFKGLASGVYSLSPALNGYGLAEGFEQEVLVNRDRETILSLKPRTR